jgi:hypothetical protein
METIFGSPWPIMFVGILVEAVLVFLLFQTGRSKLLWAIGGAAVLFGAGLVVERLVVTDREAVGNTLDAAVAAVRANDITALRKCASAAALQKPFDAAWVLQQVEVLSVGISGLEITVRREARPLTAVATFLAVARVNDKTGQLLYHGAAVKVVTWFRKEGDRWLIDSYTVEGLQTPGR